MVRASEGFANEMTALEGQNGTAEKGSTDSLVDEDPGTWRSALRSACEETSFQGIAFVVADTPFFVRRVLWFLVVVGAAIQITYQVYDRVAYYLSYPSNVNVEVNYNSTLQFPSIAICNQNDFRKTRAYEENLYDLVDQMFINEKKFLEGKEFEDERRNMTIFDLHNKLHHDVDDIVHSCQYAGHQCSSSVFKPTFTDFGVCFIYNGESGKDMQVNDVGSDVGLKLGINLEQYEYMAGSSGSAGVKVLIFEKDEVPFVKDLGVTVPPGSHALVGIELLELHNLPDPHGDCISKWVYQSYKTDNYTRTKCKMDKTSNYLKEHCGCKDHFMPPQDEPNPVYCNLKEYLTCLPEAEESLLSQEKSHCRNDTIAERARRSTCECPVPCNDNVFNPTISYSSLSKQKLYKLLLDPKIEDIKRKYNYAQEVHQRVTKSVRDEDETVFTRMLNTTDSMRFLLFEKFPEVLVKASEALKELNRTLYDAKEKHDYAFEQMEFILRWKFYRVFEVYDQRFYSPLVEAFYGAENSLKRALIELNKTSEATLKKTMAYKIEDIIHNYDFYLSETNKSMDKTINSYKTCKFIWSKDNMSPEARACYDKFDSKGKKTAAAKKCLDVDLASIPKAYISDQPDFDSHVASFFDRVAHFKSRAIDAVLDLLDKCEGGEVLDAAALDKAMHNFRHYLKRLSHSRAELDEKHFHRPIKLLLHDWQSTFHGSFELVKNKVKDMSSDLAGLSAYLVTLQNGSWSRMETIDSKAKNYLSDPNSKKIDLAKFTTDEKTELLFKEVKLFLTEIRSRAHLLKDKMQPMAQSFEEFWGHILRNENSKALHEFKNHTAFLETFEEKREEIRAQMANLASDVSMDIIIGTRDEEFLEAFAIFSAGLGLFQRSSAIDEDFVKDNFLFIDFFFRELSYQKIEQQQAYDFFALLSDIGGAMGLLVGATFVTLLECLDHFLHHYFLKRRFNERRRYNK